MVLYWSSSWKSLHIGCLDMRRLIGRSCHSKYNREFFSCIVFSNSLVVVLSRCKFEVAMLHRTGKQYTGVAFTVPDIISIAWFNITSIYFVWTLFLQTGAQYSTVEYTRLIEDAFKTCVCAPHDTPASFRMMLILKFNFLEFLLMFLES